VIDEAGLIRFANAPAATALGYGYRSPPLTGTATPSRSLI
jgi:hypothetical protein